MATGQAKTKAEELMGEAAALAAQPHPSQFEIKQLERKAKSLLKQDAAKASDVLGFVAALEYDEAAMRKHYQRALELNRGNAMTRAHYAHALARLNFPAESRDQLLLAIEIDPTDLAYLDAAIGGCVESGNIAKALDLVGRFNRLSPDKPSRFTRNVTTALDFIRQHDVSEGEIATLMETALEVLRSARASSVRLDHGILTDEDSTWLNYDLIVAEPVEKVVELNTVLCRRLALLDPPLVAEEHVLVMFLTDDSA
jgi:tetratricopeptide (TPR) repeat protein